MALGYSWAWSCHPMQGDIAQRAKQEATVVLGETAVVAEIHQPGWICIHFPSHPRFPNTVGLPDTLALSGEICRHEQGRESGGRLS